MSQWPAYSFPQMLQRLPPSARAKFNSLVAIAEDSEALLARSFDRQKALQEQRDRAAYRLAYLDKASEHEAIGELKIELEVIDAELAKLSEERAKREAIRANAAQIVAMLRDQFIPSLQLDRPNTSGAALCAVDAPPAKPRDGETIIAAITRVRSEISNAQAELQQTRNAPPTPEEIREQLHAHVQQLILAGTPTVQVDGTRVSVHWPDAPAFGAPGAVISAPSGSASRLLCCMFPDKVFEMLCAGVDDIHGISADARVIMVAEFEMLIADLEIEEESLIEQAIAAGVEVFRRSSASGFALLGIERPAMTEQLVAAE